MLVLNSRNELSIDHALGDVCSLNGSLDVETLEGKTPGSSGGERGSNSDGG